jgi:hypothetical protein
VGAAALTDQLSGKPIAAARTRQRGQTVGQTINTEVLFEEGRSVGRAGDRTLYRIYETSFLVKIK